MNKKEKREVPTKAIAANEKIILEWGLKKAWSNIEEAIATKILTYKADFMANLYVFLKLIFTIVFISNRINSFLLLAPTSQQRYLY